MAGFGKREKRERVKLEKGAYKRAARVFKFIKPYRFTFVIGMLFLVFSSLTTMGFPYLIGRLLGSEKQETTTDKLELTDLDNIDALMLLLLFVFIANAIFSYMRIFLFSIVTEGALRDIRNKAFGKLVYSDISFYDKSKVGEITSRVATDTNLLQELLMTNLAEFIRQWITIVIAVGFIFYLKWQLALIMLSVIPVVAIGAVIFSKFIKKLSKAAQDKAAESNSILEETLTGIKNVKAFANEAFEMLRYKKRTESIRTLSIKGARWRGAFAAFIILGVFGSVTFVIWQGISMVHAGEISTIEFNQFIMFTIILGASFGGIGSLMGSIQKSIGATERLMDLLDKDTEPVPTSDSISTPLSGKVSFNNVDFHYDTRKEARVLKSLSFDVNAGENIAIVGASGGGKSTITSLLLRFYEPVSGQILFDDKHASEFGLQELRKQMAIVPQEVILFSGSIRENIAYGKPDASEEEIIEAARKANALDFINDFPDGFATTVGDRGIQLSGGQKQRIAIARAVLKDPKILILDEATSSLDSESEKLVQDALDELMKGRTSFAIAHRLSTVKNADRILVMDKGELVEVGTHSDLLEKDGVYANLSKIQFELH